MEDNFKLKDTKQIIRMKEICIKEPYSYIGEIYKLLNYAVLHNLVKKIKVSKEITLNSKILFNKNKVTAEEQFIYILDKYIGYIRDNYLICHVEQLIIIEESLKNKYNKVLYSMLDFHENMNYEYYYSEFRKLFLYNLIENISFYSKYADSSSQIIKINNYLKSKNIDKDLLEIETLFKNIINARKNNIINCFVPHSEVDKNSYPFYLMQIEWVLDDYYSKNEHNEDSLIIKEEDIHSIHEIETNTLNVFNITKEEIVLIIESLEVIKKERPKDRYIAKIIKKYKSYLNIFN